MPNLKPHWTFLFGLLILLLAAALPADDLRANRVHYRMMNKLGGSAWEDVATLGFDFVVTEDGVERLRRGHLWDRVNNEYRVELPSREGGTCTVWFDLDLPSRGTAACGGTPIEGPRAVRLLEGAYKAYINDTWWLLMPFKWKDPGVNLTYIGPERHGKQRLEVVLLHFEDGTGLTSGDRYWAYVDRSTGRLEKWEMLLEGREGPPVPVVWSGWEEHAGVQFSTRKEIQGSNRAILIDNLMASTRRYPERFQPVVGARVIGTQTRPASPRPAAVEEESEMPSPSAMPSPPTPAVPAPSPPPAPIPSAKPSPEPESPVKTEDPGRARAEEVLAPVKSPPASQNGRLLVLNKADNEAVLVEVPSGRILDREPTGKGPHEAVAAPSGDRVIVTNYGHSQGGNTLSVIKVAGEDLIAEEVWDLGEHERPHGMQFDASGRLWVTAETSKAVLVLDGATGEIQRVAETGQDVSHMVALSDSAGKAFVANIGSGNITALPMGGGDAVQIEVGNGPEGIAVSPDGREVWVANRYDDQVVIVDAKSGEVREKLPTGDFPIRVAFSPDGRRAVVSNVRSGDLTVYDPRTRKTVRTIEVGSAPIGILIPPSGDKVFVALTQEGLVKVFDLVSGESVGSMATGAQPDGMAWIPN